MWERRDFLLELNEIDLRYVPTPVLKVGNNVLT